MRFTYCPDCGTRLIPRPIGDEGLVPYCEACQKPLFDMFSTCIIALVVNEEKEAALLRQGYLSTQYHTLVSGYMKPGETAEECTRREVLEEIGIPVEELTFVGTYWLERKDQLMIGFIARARKAELLLSCEVDEARWVPVEQAIHMVHPEGSVSYDMVKQYLRRL